MARSDSNLVNLIDQDDRVLDLGVIESLHNFAGNSSNVRPTVTFEQAGIT